MWSRKTTPLLGARRTNDSRPGVALPICIGLVTMVAVACVSVIYLPLDVEQFSTLAAVFHSGETGNYR